MKKITSSENDSASVLLACHLQTETILLRRIRLREKQMERLWRRKLLKRMNEVRPVEFQDTPVVYSYLT